MYVFRNAVVTRALPNICVSFIFMYTAGHVHVFVLIAFVQCTCNYDT